jgi:hypothetical protein
MVAWTNYTSSPLWQVLSLLKLRLLQMLSRSEVYANLRLPILRLYRQVRYWINSLIHPKAWQRYFRLRSLTHWSVEMCTKKLVCTDLFIVTSCTNPGDSDEAINHNLDHSQWQRGEELLATFASIRRYYPAAVIVNLENSRLEPELAHRIQAQCNQWFDYSVDTLVRESRKFSNKGVPWVIKILKFLHEKGENINATRIHLLCGRYLLTDDVLAMWKCPGAVFRYYSEDENVSTRYISYHNLSVPEIRNALWCTLRPMVFSCSVEDVIHWEGRFAKYYLPYIGVSGWVNGQQFIEE